MKVAQFAVYLAEKGFDVTVVYDGDARHHSKRATIQRQGKNEQVRVDAVYAKSKIMSVTSELSACGYKDIVKKARLNKELASPSSILSKENSLIEKIPKEVFSLDLECAIQKMQMLIKNNCKIHFLKTVTQADTVILAEVFAQ